MPLVRADALVKLSLKRVNQIFGAVLGPSITWQIGVRVHPERDEVECLVSYGVNTLTPAGISWCVCVCISWCEYAYTSRYLMVCVCVCVYLMV